MAVVHEQVERGVEEQDGHGIIEQSQDEDGMYSVAGEAHQGQDIGGNLLCPHQNSEHQSEVQNVKKCKYILKQSLPSHFLVYFLEIGLIKNIQRE